MLKLNLIRTATWARRFPEYLCCRQPSDAMTNVTAVLTIAAVLATLSPRINLAHVKDASRVTTAGGASAVPAGGGSSLLLSGGSGISLPTL